MCTAGENFVEHKNKSQIELRNHVCLPLLVHILNSNETLKMFNEYLRIGYQGFHAVDSSTCLIGRASSFTRRISIIGSISR